MRATFTLVLAGALVAISSPALAQEDEPARPDSVISDLPGELVGVLADSVDDGSFALLAPPLPPGAQAGEVVSWDRARIRLSNAVTLSELVAEMVTGVSLVRGDFYGGPHHLVDGPFGPAAVQVRIDGRLLAPMIGSQVDLTRIPLVAVDGVSVRRGAAGLEIDLTMLRREEAKAYSRVEAGTGQPGTEALRLAFTNGATSDFTIAAGYDLFDASAGTPSEFQSLYANVAWAPGDGSSGLDVQVDAGSFSRTVGTLETGNRRRAVLGGRHQLSSRLQLSGWVGSSVRELDERPEIGTPATRDEVGDGGVEIRGSWDRTWARAGFRWADHASMASTSVDAALGGMVTDAITVTAAGSIGRWDDFDTREGRIGVDWALPVAGIVVGAEGAAGVRGAPFVSSGSLSDSVRFEAVAGRIVLPLSGFVIAARAGHQRVDRQLAFGSGFDVAGSFQPGAHVTGLEASLDGPLLPMSWLIEEMDPVRIRGTFRRNIVDTSRDPLLVPRNSIRGELFIQDTFLEGDLHVRLSVGLDRREEWFAPANPGSGGSGPVLVPASTSWDVDLNVRIVGMIIFWRIDNLARTVQQDLPGFEFAASRGMFGLRWEFLD